MSGWKSVEEIVAYRRAVQLRDRILELIDGGAIPFNFRYRDDMGAAARSVPANISEGFNLYKHGRFGFHVRIALGSLGELETHLEEAHARGFFSAQVVDELTRLVIQTKRPTIGLLRHLETTEAPEPWLSPDLDHPPEAASDGGPDAVKDSSR